jgi:acetyl-CoA carboxylase biotin carboxylase subunit
MEINSLLIANRGEIAIRIARTAKRLGIRVFVIRTKKEPKALYLESADQIIDFPEIADNTPEFLNIETLISLAQEHKIDALHPGYGYLSENPVLAQRCKEAGIIFIGPSAEAINQMGNKAIARQIATKNGVPLPLGSDGNVNSTDEAELIAESIGYPVILKAASGGGGRGIRIVESSSEMQKMYKMATSEAMQAFNDGSMLIEKYISNPRHIEIQIVADKYGNVVHLGERDCSIQRKHQKLIEEAPSPALSESLRKRIGEEAIKIAKSVNYESVGTVEFLLDSNKNYYFMEMNTRIQVEHPITESITGLDLVELQLLIARGEKLSITQDDVNINGWAIECRINAEDVQNAFAPYLGKVKEISFPEGPQVRIDNGIKAGTEITPFFDSMMTKLIVYAPTREQAINLTLKYLSEIKIGGIKTTIPFCRAVLSNPAFQEGNYDTSFVEKQMDKTYFQEADDELVAAIFAFEHHKQELNYDSGIDTNYQEGLKLSPWLFNKRIQSI